MSFDLGYEPPEWTRPLICYNDYGDPRVYEEAVYKAFVEDWNFTNPVYFNERKVLPLAHKDVDGRSRLFYHIIFGGNKKTIVKPDFRRMERIRWVKDVIEHYEDNRVRVWRDALNQAGRDRISLWLDDDFMVVLEPHKSDFRLVTAFPTDIPRACEGYMKRYEAYCAANP